MGNITHSVKCLYIFIKRLKTSFNFVPKQPRTVKKKSLLRTLQTLGSVPEWRNDDHQQDSDSETEVDPSQTTSHTKKKKKRRKRRKQVETVGEQPEDGEVGKKLKEEQPEAKKKKKANKDGE